MYTRAEDGTLVPHQVNILAWLSACSRFLRNLFLVHHFLCGGQARSSDLVTQLVANTATAPRHLRIIAGHLGFLGLTNKLTSRTHQYGVRPISYPFACSAPNPFAEPSSFQHVFRPVEASLSELLMHFEVTFRPIFSYLHTFTVSRNAPPTAAALLSNNARLHYFWFHSTLLKPDAYSREVARTVHYLSGNHGFGSRRTRAFQSFICETHVRNCSSRFA